jgi:hypothetical protein
MQRLVASLTLILFMIGSVQCMAVLLLPERAPDNMEESCSCPMCRTAKPGQHCSCCTKGKVCTCNMSSQNSDLIVFQAAKPGLIQSPGEFPVAPKPELLSLTVLLPTYITYMPVLTPPPKSWF